MPLQWRKPGYAIFTTAILLFCCACTERTLTTHASVANSSFCNNCTTFSPAITACSKTACSFPAANATFPAAAVCKTHFCTSIAASACGDESEHSIKARMFFVQCQTREANCLYESNMNVGSRSSVITPNNVLVINSNFQYLIWLLRKRGGWGKMMHSLQHVTTACCWCFHHNSLAILLPHDSIMWVTGKKAIPVYSILLRQHNWCILWHFLFLSGENIRSVYCEQETLKLVQVFAH